MLLNFNSSYNYLNINKESQKIQEFLTNKGFVIKLNDKNKNIEIIFTKEIIIAMNCERKL